MKKFATMAISVGLIGAMVAGGSLAYLSDTDSDVNVMTLGNVQIEQIEQEWNADKSKLVDFTQAKPLLPYVGTLAWGDRDEENDGAYRQFDMNNVVDKYVSVKNTGKSDAYVRTIIALEMGKYDNLTDFASSGIGLSVNSATGAEFPNMKWKWTDDFMATIDGKNYNVMVAVHEDAVTPGETTIPSLLQVYLSKDAGNAEVEKLDGNGNGTYDILVLSQAVQAQGFENAATALDAAFGDITTTNHPWSEEAPVIPTAVATAEELTAALTAGESVYLTEDITDFDADNTITIAKSKEATLDLNGYTIEAVSDATGANRNLIDVRGTLTVKNGAIKYKHTGANMAWNNSTNVFNVTDGGVLNIKDAVIENAGGSDMAFAVHLNNWGEVTLNVENSTLKSTYIPVRVFNSGNDMNNVTIKNTTLDGKYCFWVHNYTLADFGTDENVEAHKALLNFDIFNGTNTFTYSSAKAPVLYGFTDSVYFDANGNKVE